jgi:hypothetical protein
MASLQDVVDDLGYAAGAGAEHLGAMVTEDARVLAEMGRPGPGLHQAAALAGRSSPASASQSFVPPAVLAHRMAVEAAQGGAELAVGKR